MNKLTFAVLAACLVLIVPTFSNAKSYNLVGPDSFDHQQRHFASRVKFVLPEEGSDVMPDPAAMRGDEPDPVDADDEDDTPAVDNNDDDENDDDDIDASVIDDDDEEDPEAEPSYEEVLEVCMDQILNGTELDLNSTEHHSEEKCDPDDGLFAFWLCLYIFIIFFLFIAIAVVCDDFFVPSLEVITERLDLSEDVAGATFMAAGSSAPELFTSVAGVGTESDVGVGTIVGSAVFNLLVIIAFTTLLARKVLDIDWRPLVRDSVFYAFSIMAFIVLSWDGKFLWWESLILLALYFLYILTMKFNPTIMHWMGGCAKSGGKSGEKQKCWSPSASNGKAIKTPYIDSSSNDDLCGSVDKLTKGYDSGDSIKNPLSLKSNSTYSAGSNDESTPDQTTITSSSEEKEKENGHLYAKLSPYDSSSCGDATSSDYPTTEVTSFTSNGASSANVDDPKSSNEEEEEEEDEYCTLLPCLPKIKVSYPEKPEECSFLGCLKFVGMWILFILAFPWLVAFTWSIPDCSKEENKKWYLVSFFVAILWIALISYLMVECSEVVGCLLGIDSYTMGLVVIATGTSVPDALSSILVARDGFGNMAVSNAIGSNVFDINLGLGLPFLIGTLARQKPILLLTPLQNCLMDNLPNALSTIPHVKFGLILLLILVLCLILFAVVRFRLRKIVGLVFLLMYLMFLAYAFVQEKICHGLTC